MGVQTQDDGGRKGAVATLGGFFLQALQGGGIGAQQDDGTAPGLQALTGGRKVAEGVVGGFFAGIQDSHYAEAAARGRQQGLDRSVGPGEGDLGIQ